MQCPARPNREIPRASSAARGQCAGRRLTFKNENRARRRKGLARPGDRENAALLVDAAARPCADGSWPSSGERRRLQDQRPPLPNLARWLSQVGQRFVTDHQSGARGPATAPQQHCYKDHHVRRMRDRCPHGRRVSVDARDRSAIQLRSSPLSAANRSAPMGANAASIHTLAHGRSLT